MSISDYARMGGYLGKGTTTGPSGAMWLGSGWYDFGDTLLLIDRVSVGNVADRDNYAALSRALIPAIRRSANAMSPETSSNPSRILL